MGFFRRLFGRTNDKATKSRARPDYGYQAAGEGFDSDAQPATWEEVYGNHPPPRSNAYTGDPGPLSDPLARLKMIEEPEPLPDWTPTQIRERYRYLLQTAALGAIEQAHTSAFAELSARQRTQAAEVLAQALGTEPPRADPTMLAQVATRAEMRSPGALEQAFDDTLFAIIAAHCVHDPATQAFLVDFSEASTSAEQGLGEDTELR